ncbi:WXG100 family type VII secretion target [Streptomyces beijiangensis]|uniref:Uncharacterized protein n=1 Tax=Streptomyces beijiangensis TaxID=163361 RepID=A0A939F363_9ACTN|nr:hypothetical protein [Streptomyces beijiangensis]MBO0511267.1 hypothetical protein [Streptomyces beijiangensis]
MPGSGFDVDPSVLKSQGGEFAKIGGDFAVAAATLKDTLAALEGDEPPWGADTIGGPFDVVYQPVKDGMNDSMESLAERLKGIGSKLQQTGANYEKTEEIVTMTYTAGS